MKTLIKTTAILLAALIITSVLPFHVFAAEIGDEAVGTMDLPIWDGSISSNYSGGDGTPGNPYIINHGADLALLAKKVNSGTNYSSKYFKIGKDIILNDYSDWESWSVYNKPQNIFTSIGSSDRKFNGNIDGLNHTIYGLYTNGGGLISFLYYGSVRNLGLDCSFVSGNTSVGGLIGNGYGTVENCYNKAHVEGTKNVGGICGYADGRFNNCYNEGYISGSSYVGGIFGDSWSSTFTMNINTGKVKGSSYVGGIGGYLNTSSGGGCTVDRCINDGEIIGSYATGGILGYDYNEEFNGRNVNVTLCVNNGNISGSSYAGGIVGMIYAYWGYPSVNQCTNNGNVSGYSGVGGIVGQATLRYDGTYVRNCSNTGSVKANNKNAGGIIGLTSGDNSYYKVTCNYNINVGAVNSPGDKGSIVGADAKNLSLNKCYYLEQGGMTVNKGTSLTLYQLAVKSSFSGLDFSSTWKIDLRKGYPVVIMNDMPLYPSQKNGLDIDTAVDQYMIEQVTKYTSDDITSNTQYNAIMQAQISGEVKLKLLNELFKNEGFTDAKAGIAYLRDTSPYRNDYKFLTTNEIYCAHNYFEWLNSEGYGTFARGLLYADGLIFNGELMSFVDINTYTDNNYPGVKKNKELLRTFLESNCDEVLSSAKEAADFFSDLTELNGWSDYDPEAEINTLMDNVLQAKTKTALKKAQRNFAERIAAEVQNSQSKRLQLNGRKISEALGYSAAIISFVGASADNILSILNMEQEIAKYTYFKDFLTEIASCRYASGEMRMAANSLLGDIKSGYFNRVISLLGNIFSLEMGIISVKTDLMEELFGAGGALAGEALTTLSLAAFISNLVIDTGDFVRQVAYTQGYAELAAIYSLKLQQDKIDFKANPTAENAWQFFEDYTMLWSLRQKGEEQYLNMNELKMFVFGKIKASNYTMKQGVVQDNLNLLDQKKFEFAAEYTVPANVMYSAKAIINCPVDVYVYASDGTLVAKLTDGVESDVSNEYGRFAVMKQSYSGEYTKVIASSIPDQLKIKTVAHSMGLIDYDFAISDDYGGISSYSISNIAVEKDSVLHTSLASPAYTLDFDGNGEADIESEMDWRYSGHIAVSSITTDASDCVMKTGQQKLIRASVYPTNATVQTLDWFTDNEKVVSVQNGVVTALDKGIAHVYAKSIDNEEAFCSFKVQVVRRNLLLGDVTLDDQINISDATWIQMYLSEYLDFNQDQKNAADVDQNQKIEIADTTLIQKFLVELHASSAVGEEQPSYIDTQYTVFGNFEESWDPDYETGYHMNCLTDYGEFGKYTYTFEALPAGYYRFGITDGTGALRTDTDSITGTIPSGYYAYIGQNGQENGSYMELVITDDADVTIHFDEKTKTATLDVAGAGVDSWWSTGDETGYHSDNPFTAFGTCGEKTAYALYPDGSVTIFGRGNMNDSCPFEDKRNGITSVTVKAGVNSIGANAFADAVNLESVQLCADINSIGESAFANTGIRQISIPENVTSIGTRAFSGCTQLTAIAVDENNAQYLSDDGVLYNKTSLALIAYPAGKLATAYTLRDGCTAITEGAMNQCATIEKLVIPQSVTLICDYAFEGCSHLFTIEFLGPEHIWEEIDISASSGLAADINMIYHYYQRPYQAVGNLSDPCHWDANEEYDFAYVSDDGNYGVYDLVMENVPSGHYHFNIVDGKKSSPVDFYLTKATSLRIKYDEYNNRISFETSVPNCAFTIAKSEGRIIDSYSCGDNAYYTMYENGLLVLSGQGELWYVPMYSMVKKAIILDGITDITNYAFYCGEQLEEVYLSSTVSGVVSQCFYGCTNLKSILVNTENPSLCVEDNVLFNKNKTTLICYPAQKPDATYTIPENILSIEENAFAGCAHLTEITLPDSLTVFSASCVNHCESLTVINVKDTNTKWTQENGVLYDKNMEILVFYPFGKQEQLFALPETVHRISAYSLKSSAITTLSIPKSVDTIDGYAFQECYSLSDIEYGGTEEEWNAVNKNENMNPIFNSVTIHFQSSIEDPTEAPTSE